MTPARRTIATAVVSGAAAVGMALTAVPAVAHTAPHNTGGDHHGDKVTLAQAKKYALHGLAVEVKVLNRFESIANADPYVGPIAQKNALTAADKQEARDKSAATKVSAATSKERVAYVLHWAHDGGKKGEHHAKHESLLTQKNRAQLALDGQKAFLQQRIASSGKAQPKLKSAVAEIATTKKAVDAAKTEKQLQQALGRDCGGAQRGH